MNAQTSDPTQESLRINRLRASKLSALLGNPEFRWFVDEILKPKLDEAQEKALATGEKDTAETRNIACHVRAALKEIHDWPEEELKIALGRIKSLDKSQ